MAAGGNGENSEKKAKARVEVTPGSQIYCKTRFNDEYRGTVTGYDCDHKVIFIKCQSTETSSKKNNFDIVMINLNHVPESNFKILSLHEAVPSMPPEYDLEKIGKRYQISKGEKLRAAERVGVNVSQEAQLLFNCISKFYPDCYWQKEHIIVMDDVKISPPYKPEHCSGKKSVDQIRKMVEKFHNDKQNDEKLIS